MERELYSRTIDCNNNCLYCFAKWGKYKQPLWKGIREDKNIGGRIIYPCCDGEFFQQDIDLRHIIKDAQTENCYISISTKNLISEEQILELVKVNEYLTNHNVGFVKIGIPFTTKYRIEEIECNTASYEERVDMAKKLITYGFKVCVIFKPILPFISIDEYKEIVKDLSFVNKFLLGDLYVDKKSIFYRDYISKELEIKERKVGWLKENLIWDVIEQKEKKSQLVDYINKLGGKVYHSDVEVIESYIQGNRNGYNGDIK